MGFVCSQSILTVLCLLATAVAGTAAQFHSTADGNSIAAPVTPPPDQNTMQLAYEFSAKPFFKYPGGYYKHITTEEFPASASISGSLISLKPGGLRELHWHDPDEWAYVLEGVCRATIVDIGAPHQVESWDFKKGDVWYFPQNLGHAILAVGEEGCTYVAGYNDGAFAEHVDAMGVSNLLTTNPPEITEQVFGASPEAVRSFHSPNKNHFIAQGNLARLTAGQTLPPPILAATAAPVQPPRITDLSHRYPLADAGHLEINTPGGTIRQADKKHFPASTTMSGALVYMRPGSFRQLHWHPTHDEWQYVINGTVKMAAYDGPGQFSGPFTLREGDVGFAKRGTGHWILNEDLEKEAYILLIFNAGTFTNVDLTNWLGQYPLEYMATSLGTSSEVLLEFDFTRTGIVNSPATCKPSELS